MRETMALSVLREIDLLLRGRLDWALDNASMWAKTACAYDRGGGNREVRQSRRDLICVVPQCKCMMPHATP